MKHRILHLALAAIFLAGTLHAQVPQLLNYQGRVAVGAVNFEGTGSFKFALVNPAGTTTFWSNDNTSVAGAQPTAAVALTVARGLYSVLLGDTSPPLSMTAIPASVWTNPDVRLRVWFNDGTNGSQQLTPDQRLAPNGYLPDGAVGPAAIASGAITSAKIAAGAVTSTQLAAGAVANGNLANSGITVAAGSGLGGGGAVSLGGSVALTNSGVLSLTGGGGINVNAGTGAITLGSNATSANTPSTIVLRDTNGDFSARTITLSGNLTLPATSATAGVITQNGSRLMHTFGSNNFFAGPDAGNFTGSGSQNTATGVRALQSMTGGYSNVASGYEALYRNAGGDNNTASGWKALTFNTGGSSNTAIGSSALSGNTTGDNNTAIGRSAMGANSIGIQNTAIGVTALFGNSTGSSNTASGFEALRNNSTGYFNTASGAYALSANSTGYENTANGANALIYNGTGLQNTANGVRALESNTGGSNNTAIGVNALRFNTTGSNNIALGNGAGNLFTTGGNNIAIGHAGVAGESGMIRIGTAQTDTFLTGIIHGNGAGLNSVPAGSITGTIMATQIASAGVTSAKLAVPNAPAAGQVLSFDGSSLNWINAGNAVNETWSLNGTSAFYNAGKVGIGTNAPATSLHVNSGSFAVTGASGPLNLQGIGNGLVITTAAFGDPAVFMNAGNYDNFPSTPIPLLLQSANGGAVGIGNTPRAGYRLDVGGAVAMTTGGSGGEIFFSTPNAETGMSIIGVNRADLRFDGSTFKMVVGPVGAPPSANNGIAVSVTGNVGIGTTDPQAKLHVIGTIRTSVLSITGGADLAEPFAMSHGGITAGSVVSIDPEHPGKLRRCAAAYDRKVAGIVSGANGIQPGISMIDEQQLEPGENVALSGRVYVKANASAGAIAPGDLLTTSDVPGEAMKAADAQRAQGCILGKAMTPLDETTGTVLVLVTLQ